MMHSKVYLFEGSARATAIVGSHNLTGFAIAGQNTEASVLIDAPASDPLIQQVRDHISAVRTESQMYDPTMRLAYAWWFRSLFEGMQRKTLYGGGEEGMESDRNVVLIGVSLDGRVPQPGEIVYLEVPAAFKVLKALGQPVHFYVMSKVPATVASALTELPVCVTAFRGNVTGTNEAVVNEGDAQWIIRDLRNPLLESTVGQVFPTPNRDDIQAFIKIIDILSARYKYHFESPKKWRPIYDKSEFGEVIAADQLHHRLRELNLIPKEHLPWYRVVGLEPDLQHGGIKSADWEASPESGRFLLFSRARQFLGTVGSHAVPERQQSTSAAIDAIPAEVWFAAAKWAKENRMLENWQRSLAYSLGKLAARGASASQKQATQGKRLLLEAVEAGFAHDQLNERAIEQLRAEDHSR
jgi:hypothetical protein